MKQPNPEQERFVDPHMSFARQIRAGNVRALSRAISLVENSSPEATALLAACHGAADSIKLGFTGAPGAGKSTLVDQFARRLRKDSERVGIVAVDPTSPFSGGAILGDRIRMGGHQGDAGLYIRSMATRGFLGGLAGKTADVCALMEAAGWNRILVETVGVGQDEVDIVRLADVTIVVLVPGMGDDVQSIKAGIMEIADIFVINKCDREGADRVEQEVKAMQSLAMEHTDWTAPIVRTVATSGEGVDSLHAEVAKCIEYLRSSGRLQKKRISAWRQRLEQMLREEMLLELEARGFARERLDQAATEIVESNRNPYEFVPQMLRELLRG